MVGDRVVTLVGALVGDLVGRRDGFPVVGTLVGILVGRRDGFPVVGTLVGSFVGPKVGLTVEGREVCCNKVGMREGGVGGNEGMVEMGRREGGASVT
jgi:uncharacterized protein YqgC (DUF456 family)